MSGVTEIMINASLVPLSEVLSKIIEEINATVIAAKDVLIEQESFITVSSFLERIVPVLKELIRRNTDKYESLNAAIETLSREVRVARHLTSDCCTKNKVYLLINCRRIVKKLQDTTREISRALSLIPLASLDLSSSIKEEVDNLCNNMLEADFRAAVAEERLLQQIESGIQEQNADRASANKLLVQIAKVVGVSTERSGLKKVIDDFKNEIEEARLRKDQAEAMQMEQIITLLGRADAALSPREREEKYFRKRDSLGNQPLEPLQSFYCPITGDVMVDPVETSSGQTFERSAIEKWLADRNTTCPLTMIPLISGMLRPNITLRKSIEEWKDRNTMITISQMRSKLSSGNDEEVIQCLSHLLELCKERDLHREWVALENCIPVLVGFLDGHHSEIRQHALAILCVLAKDHDDNKERISEVNNSIEFVVRGLARRIAESKLAVALLLELSKLDVIRDHIGKARGCILLLVTLSNGDNAQAANDAMALLENLSFIEEYVVQMAKANYFKPLLERLSSGSNSAKKTMAETLAEMELTDHSKSTLFDDGVFRPLLQLVTEGDEKSKQVAARALSNLSTLPRNALIMIREGTAVAFLHLLFPSSAQNFRDHVADTIMNLALAALSPEAGDSLVPLLESDDDIVKLFSVISLNPPRVQRSILRTFCALCQPPSATDMRTKLRQPQFSAVPLLVQLCEHSELDLGVRENAVKLFYYLTGEGEDALLDKHTSKKFFDTLVQIMRSSGDKDEKTASIGIISNLSRDNDWITQQLLDAGALEVVISVLESDQKNGAASRQLIENAAGALCRFTVSSHLEWQKRSAELGIIPVLVQMLGWGSPLAKQYAAISLAQFSDNSSKQSRRLVRSGGFFCCTTPAEATCPVHLGVCSVEQSFCLVEAGSVDPLVGLLGDTDMGVRGASLQALSTLIEGERFQNGCKVISEANGIPAIIKLLSAPAPGLQEKALITLERIFRREEYKRKYGPMAQMALVDITQRGTPTMKPLAARILAHLNVLHDQSSYF